MNVKPVPGLDPIIVGENGLTQPQFELIRTKLIQLAAAVNRTVSMVTSTAIRVLSGELGNSPTLPRGMMRYVFSAASTAEEVAHGLDRVPTGYLVIRRYPLGTVADASLADWNMKTVWLQTDVVGLDALILFF